MTTVVSEADWFNGETLSGGPLPDDSERLTSATELEEAVAAVDKVGVGDRPVVPEPIDPTVELPRGVPSLDGSWQQLAVVRELTGADEEVLARIKDDQMQFDTVLALGVTRIGDIEFGNKPLSERRGILNSLLVAEKWLLFFHVASTTFGDHKEIQFTCPKCDTEMETDVIISEDFPVKFPDGQDDFPSRVDFATSSGSIITFRLTTGEDVSDLMSNKTITQAEVTSKLLSRLIVSVDGKPPLDPVRFTKEMPLKDRMKLVETIANSQPSVDLTLNIPCTSCGEEVVLPFTWGAFFRP